MNFNTIEIELQEVYGKLQNPGNSPSQKQALQKRFDGLKDRYENAYKKEKFIIITVKVTYLQHTISDAGLPEGITEITRNYKIHYPHGLAKEQLLRLLTLDLREAFGEDLHFFTITKKEEGNFRKFNTL